MLPPKSVEKAPQKVKAVQESKPTIVETNCSVKEQFFPNWACKEKKGLYIAVGSHQITQRVHLKIQELY